MREPTVPKNEEQRLERLRAYEILDTLPESVYDDIVGLAAHVCQVPIALVSLVDKDRQWFKARHGLGASETPRSVSFCGHVVESGEILQVNDAFQDERFADNPLAVGPPNVRFYVGTPLATSDGLVLGTLCVIDNKARSLTEQQVKKLEALSRLVMQQLELRTEIQSRKKLETDLRAARDEAVKANQIKSTFLSHMSHELRTPLNSIIGFTGHIAKNKNGRLEEKELHYLSRVASNGKHLLALINDILDLSKIEANRTTLKLESVDLDSFLREVADTMSGAAEDNNNELRLDLPERIEPIQADPRRLNQILINLLGNAIKFTDEGVVELRLLVDDKSVPQRIDIVDTGAGIPDELLTTIFQPFRQVDEGHQRAVGGTGLGLTISRSLAELHGFTLEATSVVGEGSTFTLRLSNVPG